MSSDYENNAYIAALPPTLTRPEWVRRLNYMPMRDEAERGLPHQDRYLCALRVLRFFRAGARQAEFARGFDAVLREGYRGRDDSTRAHEIRMHAIATARESGDLRAAGTPVVIRNASSSALIGVPGMGKTASLDRVLSRYPQVVRHADGQIQIVWLKLECPSLGAIRQTCKAFLKSVDDVLGQKTYQNMWKGKHVSDDELMDAMVTVANIHSLGCLVIDEIQHLGKAGDEQHVLMTFLTTLVNKIGVPVLFVGTMAAFERFSKTGRMGRRAIGPASAVWHQYKPTDDQWQVFIEELWEYQWTSQYTPPTPELLAALYARSQGVVDIVTKLWFSVQAAAIDDNEASGGEVPEVITVKLINAVAEVHLAPMERLLKAIREDDHKVIAEYDDVKPRTQEFWKSLKERNGPVLNKGMRTEEVDEAAKLGPAHVGQCCAVVRDNLESRDFDDAKVAEVMRRTSEIVGAPDYQNIGRYFAEVDKVIAQIEAEAVKPVRAVRPSKAEVEATMEPGDLRREDGDGMAEAA